MVPKSNDRAHLKRGRPDYHDPTAGIGGAAPAYSALTLRIVLSSLGVVFGIAITVLGLTVVDEPVVWVGGILLSVLAAINLAVVLRRKRRGEPG